jgi:hypothetical protein
LVYDGTEKTGVTGTHVSISGTVTETEAGTYSVVVEPHSNYAWSDGTHGAKTVSWTIARLNQASYTENTNLYYKNETLTGVTGSHVTISGHQQKNAGVYTATVTPIANYCWKDGTHDPIKVEWEIYRAKDASVSGNGSSVPYTGKTITGITGSNVEWVSGTRSATLPGTYTVKVKPATNHAWSDGTYGEKTVSWTIKGYVFAAGDKVTIKSGAKYYDSASQALKDGSYSDTFGSGNVWTAVIEKFYNASAKSFTNITPSQTDADTYCAFVEAIYKDGKKYTGSGYLRLDDLTN